MKNYSIKKSQKDFYFLDRNYNVKGTRPKRMVLDSHNNYAIFKYEHPNYNCSEACSEKICYEIAKVLKYQCAKIEIAVDENQKLGVLNYIFTNKNIQHSDAISYLNLANEERCNFYTIASIKQKLDKIDISLFDGFVGIMIFDALVGEQDRHEENWGIQTNGTKYKISPLYDNGCCLLKELKDINFAKKFYELEKRNKEYLDMYINKSKTLIYKEDNKHKYKHFELINELNILYPDIVKKYIDRLKLLTDKKIESIIGNVPLQLLTKEHKEHIIMYLKKRRNILLKIR